MPKKLNNNLIVALDIGTSKVVAIVAGVLPDGRLEIVGVGSYPSTGMRKGVIVNIDAVVNSIQRAVEEAELMAGCQIHAVYTGIAGSHIRSFNSRGIVAIKNQEVTKLDIERVIDAAKAVAIPADQKILHILPQEFMVDNQTGIKEPLGMAGVRLEANIHMITSAVSCAQNITNCVRRCDLDVADITLEQLASSYAVLAEDEKYLGVCILDIGAGTTDVAVFTDGAIRHTASIPVAGDQVTNDLAVAFRIATEAAENIKLKYGCALTELADAELRVDVTYIGEGKTQSISQFNLTNVIEPRYEELFCLVRDELTRVGLDGALNAGIVLTGGSSKISGIMELAESVFKLPVRLGVPHNILGLTEVLKAPTFSTGIGLLLYGLRSSQRKVKGRCEPSGSIHSTVSKIKNWFQGNF